MEVSSRRDGIGERAAAAPGPKQPLTPQKCERNELFDMMFLRTLRNARGFAARVLQTPSKEFCKIKLWLQEYAHLGLFKIP